MPENILHSILADKQISQKELTKQVQKATHDELVKFASDIKNHSLVQSVAKKWENQPILHTSVYDPNGNLTVNGYLADWSLKTSIPTKEVEYVATRTHVEQSNIYPEIPLFITKYADSLAYDFHQKIGNPLLQSDQVKQQWFDSLGKYGAKVLTLVINYLGTDVDWWSYASLDHFNTIMKWYGRKWNKVDITSVSDVIYEVFKNFNDNDKWSFGLGKRYVPNIDIVDYQEYQNFTKYLYNQTQADSYETKKQGLLTTMDMYDDTHPSAEAKNEMQIALMDRMYLNEDGTFAPYAYQDAADGSLDRMVELKQSLLAQKTDDGSYDRTHAMGRTDVFEDRDVIRKQQANDAIDRQISLCDQAIRSFQQVVDTPTSDVDVWSNFSKGFADGVGIPFIKSFTELYEAYDLYNISKRPLAQQTLAERALLESVSLLSQMSQFTPRAYRVGQWLGSTVTQLPEFMVTGWVFKRWTKWATKFMQYLVRKWLTTGIEKSIVRQWVRSVAWSLVQSSLWLSHQAITIGLGRMTSKFPVTVDFHTGQVVLDESNKQLWEWFVTAMAKWFGVNWVQTLTERMWFDTAKIAKQLFGRVITRELKATTVATQWTFEQAWGVMSKKIGEKMALTDPFGEYYEEFLSTRFSDLITGDKNILDINSSDELDTFLICALMGVGQVWAQLTGKQLFKSADQWVQLTAQLEQMKQDLLSNPNLTAQDLILAQQTMRTNGVSAQQIAQTIVDVVKWMGINLDNVTVPPTMKNKIVTRTIATAEQQAENAALIDQLAENPTDGNLIKEFAKRLKIKAKELTTTKIQAIIDAHNSPGQRWNLTMSELRAKTKILQDADISRDRIDILFDGGYCAKKSYASIQDYIDQAPITTLQKTKWSIVLSNWTLIFLNADEKKQINDEIKRRKSENQKQPKKSPDGTAAAMMAMANSMEKSIENKNKRPQATQEQISAIENMETEAETLYENKDWHIEVKWNPNFVIKFDNLMNMDASQLLSIKTKVEYIVALLKNSSEAIDKEQKALDFGAKLGDINKIKTKIDQDLKKITQIWLYLEEHAKVLQLKKLFVFQRGSAYVNMNFKRKTDPDPNANIDLSKEDPKQPFVIVKLWNLINATDSQISDFKDQYDKAQQIALWDPDKGISGIDYKWKVSRDEDLEFYLNETVPAASRWVPSYLSKKAEFQEMLHFLDRGQPGNGIVQLPSWVTIYSGPPWFNDYDPKWANNRNARLDLQGSVKITYYDINYRIANYDAMDLKIKFKDERFALSDIYAKINTYSEDDIKELIKTLDDIFAKAKEYKLITGEKNYDSNTAIQVINAALDKILAIKTNKSGIYFDAKELVEKQKLITEFINKFRGDKWMGRALGKPWLFLELNDLKDLVAYLKEGADDSEYNIISDICYDADSKKALAKMQNLYFWLQSLVFTAGSMEGTTWTDVDPWVQKAEQMMKIMSDHMWMDDINFTKSVAKDATSKKPVDRLRQPISTLESFVDIMNTDGSFLSVDEEGKPITMTKPIRNLINKYRELIKEFCNYDEATKKYSIKEEYENWNISKAGKAKLQFVLKLMYDPKYQPFLMMCEMKSGKDLLPVETAKFLFDNMNTIVAIIKRDRSAITNPRNTVAGKDVWLNHSQRWYNFFDAQIIFMKMRIWINEIDSGELSKIPLTAELNTKYKDIFKNARDMFNSEKNGFKWSYNKNKLRNMVATFNIPYRFIERKKYVDLMQKLYDTGDTSFTEIASNMNNDGPLNYKKSASSIDKARKETRNLVVGPSKLKQDAKLISIIMQFATAEEKDALNKYKELSKNQKKIGRKDMMWWVQKVIGGILGRMVGLPLVGRLAWSLKGLTDSNLTAEEVEKMKEQESIDSWIPHGKWSELWSKWLSQVYRHSIALIVGNIMSGLWLVAWYKSWAISMLAFSGMQYKLTYIVTILVKSWFALLASIGLWPDDDQSWWDRFTSPWSDDKGNRRDRQDRQDEQENGDSESWSESWSEDEFLHEIEIPIETRISQLWSYELTELGLDHESEITSILDDTTIAKEWKIQKLIGKKYIK